jgi:hypothetical protein
VLSAKYDVLLGCRTVADIWVHGDVKWAGEQFAYGVESGMDGSSEAWWDCMLVVQFQSYDLGSASCGLWVVTLHEFGEFLGEVSCWRVFVCYV